VKIEKEEEEGAEVRHLVAVPRPAAVAGRSPRRFSSGFYLCTKQKTVPLLLRGDGDGA